MAQEFGLYSIWDRKAGYYLPAFNLKSDAEASREFQNIVTSSDTPVSKYPADFDLVRIGTIDMETGYITPVNPGQLLVNGLVSLEDAHRQRSRYQSILSTIEQEEPAPEAS